MRTKLITVVLGATLVGCGPSSVLNEWDRAEINDSESLREWSVGSAPQVIVGVGVSVSAIIAAAAELSEGGCPVRAVEGDTTTFTGDCTDSAGNAWFGKATVKGSAEAEGEDVNHRFEEFGFSGPEACDSGATSTGRVTVSGTSVATPVEGVDGTRYTYDLRIDQTTVDSAACAPVRETWAYSYSGESLRLDGSTTWYGSGRIGSQTQGTVEVSTDEEVLNSSVCAGEALSGTTTIKGKDTTAVITYDGATDCSDESTVTWTLDGVEMGTVNGITCSSATGAPLGFALLALLGLGLKRRRS